MKLIAIPSPNFAERQDDIHFIILHATGTKNLEETFSYLIDSVAPKRVSAHYVIDRDGTVYVLVDENKTAWHAGISDFENYAKNKGTNSLNDSSIGIELQAPALSYAENGEALTFGNFTTEQFNTCLELCRRIMKRHKILPRNILRHSDIAKGRKFDTGATFDFSRFKKELERE